MSRFLGIFIFACAVAGLALAGPVGTGKVGQDTGKGKDKIDPSKLKPDPAKVQAQKERGEKLYKEIFETEEAPFYETSHFLIFGKSGRTLVSLGGDLEKAYGTEWACRALDLPPNPGPWPGKLTIFLIHDAKRYPQAIRILQRRRVDDDEIGMYEMDGSAPFVAACPGKNAGEQSMESTACTQMGAWLVSYKGRTRLPDWLAQGFGRATMLHVWGATTLAADRRKAAAFVTKNNRALGDVTSDNLNAEEMPVLRASVVDYLAYSGRTSKFLPILSGFASDGKNDPGSFNVGLQKAGISEEDLNKNWLKFVKGTK
jgi:hypothetical protein